MTPHKQVFKFIGLCGEDGATTARIRSVTGLPLRMVNKCVLDLWKDGYVEKRGRAKSAIVYVSKQLQLPVTHETNR